MLLICNCLKAACARAVHVGATAKHHCALGEKEKPCAALTSRNSITERGAKRANSSVALLQARQF